MFGLWIFGWMLTAIVGAIVTIISHCDDSARGVKWGSRLLIFAAVWPAMLVFYIPTILAASSRAGGWLWRAAELPVPRVLRAKVYDADAGALSETTETFQAGELSTVLPPAPLAPPSKPTLAPVRRIAP